MSLKVRRVVAANNAAGKCVVVSDEVIDAVSRGVGVGVTGSEMWSTDQMPVDNSPSADNAQREGFVKRFNDFNWVGSEAGTTFRITEWRPVMRSSAIVRRQWTMTSCCQARSI
jgi:hypothetical protein